MKILLVSANRERSPYPVFPIGLAYLAGPLSAAGHELSVLDLCFEEDAEAALSHRMSGFSPDLVLISLRNMDNVTWPASRSYLEGAREAVSCCRGRVPVIVGGSGFSLMPREVLEYLQADYGVVGEGEQILPRMVERLAAGQSMDGLPGVLTRGSDGMLPSCPVTQIGTPVRTLFDVSRYQREGGMANVQTKRGCPFSCIYCTYPLLEGRAVRLRPIADILTELRSLAADGISYIYFVDDIFNYPMEFAQEFCRRLKAENLPLNWSAFINPAFMSPALLESMQAAGCDAIEFGTESGSPLMLARLGKSFDVAAIRSASLLCRQAGLDFAHYILFGGPGETRDTIMETFALMDEITPTAVIAMTGIRIFPGTELYRTALSEGIIGEATDMLQPTFYISPLVAHEISGLVTAQASARSNWVAPGLEVNMNDAMLGALRQFQIKGPLWKLLKRVQRTRTRPQ